MSIRLNKVTKYLNVGLSTIVKFLHSKGYSPEENPNTKISNEEYEMLNKEFNKDKNLKLNLESKKNDTESFYLKEKNHTKIVNNNESIQIKKTEPFFLFKKEEIKKRQFEIDTLNMSKHSYKVKKSSVEKKSIEEDTPNYDSNRKENIFRLQNSTKQKINFTITGKIDLTTINNFIRTNRKPKDEKQKWVKNKKTTNMASCETLKTDTREKLIHPLQQVGIEVTKKKKRNRIKHRRIDINQNVSIHSKKKNKYTNSNKSTTFNSKINKDDIQKQVKKTLAKLSESSLKKGTKYRKEKRDILSQQRNEQSKLKEQENKVIKLTEFVTANDLANMMNIPVVQVISTCMSIGIMVSINQRLDTETIDIVADEFGYRTEYVSEKIVNDINDDGDQEQSVPRPPIITIMGHVDHGKTSLLDNIRNSNIISSESGGITQHIGAYHVKLKNGRKITFLDTPGHEVFTAMRARGAKVTDIVIIIIAADDNVMPQTIEAINHAAAAEVPIVFAINKIDKSGANPEKIKEALSSMNYLIEDWGGKYQSQDISAKNGNGIKELLEKVLLEAELLDLKANPKRKATGSVIESSLDKGRGYVVTILVQNGTIKLGNIILAGTYFGRIKALFNEKNQKINEAGPSEAILILGLNGAPQAGDIFQVMETEQEAREIATKRIQLQREQGLRTQKLLTLDDISRRISAGNFQQLNIIVKGDVDGSIEALSDSLIRLSTEQVQVNIIHKGVGQISESDVILAAASNAFIIGFQIRPSQSARKLAEKEGVDIRLYSIIYNAIEELKNAISGMLAPKIKEKITATVEIHEIYKLNKIGSVAGCIVKEGRIKREDKIHLIRNGAIIYTGELASLKRYKENVKEVTQGYECGLNIYNFNDIKVGDIIETFEEIKSK
ncbi:MAG: translation initiation factor IF-2 [Bacteroidales bacterium OttesenSCG-928-I14]|jgi:translation initiation factor IF-2|nr:translation initiation factor IF-2 [Bacteroidales bacterium OttesenSCG-928-I14]